MQYTKVAQGNKIYARTITPVKKYNNVTITMLMVWYIMFHAYAEQQGWLRLVIAVSLMII